MSAPDGQYIKRSRRKLLLIIFLFLLPPAAAWMSWLYLGEVGVGATTNAGTLVSPARPLVFSGLVQADGGPLTDADLRGRWTYVLFVPGTCDTRCERQLYLTRQIRLAMSKDVSRVQRLLVFGRRPDPALVARLDDEHADLRWVIGDLQVEGALRDFRGDGFGVDGEHYFLVDPLGNLMMYYDLDVSAKGMMKDLQKLLKISQIG